MISSPCSHRPESEDIGAIALNLVDHLDAMVAYWDENQVCRFANNAYRIWFGKTREQIIGRTIQELLGPLYVLNLPHIRAALAGQVQVFEREISTPGGRIRQSLATYTPDIVNGRVRGIYVHVADVTPMKELERQLIAAKEKAEHLATHDFLTGLPNRVLLMDRIGQAIEIAKRKQHMVALLSIDIDDYKQINDTYGHALGDMQLVEIATRAKQSVRKTDTLTRLGGDEFLLLLPEVTAETEVRALAAHLLGEISRPYQLGEVTTSPTFSVGIALFPVDGTTPEELMANSDRALYLAKRLGKNRFAFVPRP